MSLLCIAAAALAACGGGDRQTGSSAARLAVGVPGLTLQLIPVRDTVLAGEPVLVLQLLHNSAEERKVLYGPEMIDIAVTGPDGRSLSRWENQPLMHGNRPGHWTTLPPNGVVGDVADLTCGAPVNALENTVEARGCAWKYAFNQSGAYRLVGYYGTVADPTVDKPRAGVDYLSLRSDTVTIVVRAR